MLWLVTAAGASVIVSFDTGIVMTAGLAVFGFDFGMIIHAFVEWTGTVCSAAVILIGAVTVTSSMYFGDFASMAWRVSADTAFGEHIESNLWVTAAYGLFSVPFF